MSSSHPPRKMTFATSLSSTCSSLLPNFIKPLSSAIYMIFNKSTNLNTSPRKNVDQPDDDWVHYEFVICFERGRWCFRRSFPPRYWDLSHLYIRISRLHCIHPSCIKIKHARQGNQCDVVAEEEFVKGERLTYYVRIINRFSHFRSREFKTNQVQMCKSVARQLLEYCSWLHEVIKTPHRNINPNTILLQQDGVVKMRHFNYITQRMVTLNPFFFTRSCAFLAPEYEGCDAKGRVETDYANDIWAVGAVLYAIMKGRTLLPTIHKIDAYKRTTEELRCPLPEQLEKELHKNYMEFVRFVTHATVEQWNELFVDASLAGLARACLRLDPHQRPRASELLSYIYIVGGLTQANYNESSATPEQRDNLTRAPSTLESEDWHVLQDAWATDIARLAKTDYGDQIVRTIRAYSKIAAGGRLLDEYNDDLSRIVHKFLVFPTADRLRRDEVATAGSRDAAPTVEGDVFFSSILSLAIVATLLRLENAAHHRAHERLIVEADEVARKVITSRLVHAKIALNRSMSHITLINGCKSLESSTAIRVPVHRQFKRIRESSDLLASMELLTIAEHLHTLHYGSSLRDGLSDEGPSSRIRDFALDSSLSVQCLAVNMIWIMRIVRFDMLTFVARWRANPLARAPGMAALRFGSTKEQCVMEIQDEEPPLKKKQ